MTDSNGSRSARGGDNSKISPETQECLVARSLAFQKGTQRKGMPMTYGAGKGPVKLPPVESSDDA